MLSNEAGEAVRVKFMQRLLLATFALSAALGAWAALCLLVWLGGGAVEYALIWVLAAAGLVGVVGVLSLLFWANRFIEAGWRLSEIELLGSVLERHRRVGQALQYRLCGEGCAFAHSVVSLDGCKEIQHVVVAGSTAWVVESVGEAEGVKTRNRALEGIARKMGIVKGELGEDVHVQGFLVVDGAPGRKVKVRVVGDVEVSVGGIGALERRLCKARGVKKGPGGDTVLNAVWTMGLRRGGVGVS